VTLRPSGTSTSTTSAAFFDSIYEGSTDPWSFASDAYEQARYRTVLDHVDPARHRRVFEPGCSVGVLTEQLGRRGDRVDATDVSVNAVARARARCAHLPAVDIRIGGVLPTSPDPYDLIVFSEVGYYLDVPSLYETALGFEAALRRGGRLIAAHWIGNSDDHVLHGRDVHRVLTMVLDGWHRVHHAVHPDAEHDGFVLDVWDRS
jgi:2-polyprenyl-3-methyl-5-hydroxy-6-metoxy-1,4-benzoquinol methylase